METKIFEIRDRATFIPALAVRLQINPGSSNEEWLLRRAGYAPDDIERGTFVLLVTLAGGNGRAICDPHDWGGITFPAAHQFIAEHWDELQPGSVIDAEFLRAERKEPRLSERLTEIM
jgi:hypothetical protein